MLSVESPHLYNHIYMRSLRAVYQTVNKGCPGGGGGVGGIQEDFCFLITWIFPPQRSSVYEKNNISILEKKFKSQ